MRDFMSRWFFNLAYLAILAVAWPWLLVAAWRKGKYREGGAEKFFGLVPPRQSTARCVWLHAVSVGEVNLLQTLLPRIEREYPEWDVVISTTTATGYALAKKRYAPRTVFYAPLDFSWAIETALARVRPDLIILAELEVWPNWVRCAQRRGIKLAVVNGRLSDNSIRGYQRLRFLLGSTFAKLDLVAAQNEEYATRFRDLGASQVISTGSLKFDGAQADRANPRTRTLATLAGIREQDLVFLAGSTQSPEESLAVDAFECLAEEFPQLRLILVPRHPERFSEVAEMLDRRGVAWQRRSLLDDKSLPVTSDVAAKPRILLVDAVGELQDWWGLAHIAFVGGSMGSRGGQNMIEPAAYSAAICFGPNTSNFRDVVTMLLANNAAEVVKNGNELTQFVNRCLRDSAFANTLGFRAAELVRQQQGAAERTMQLLRPLFHSTSGPARRHDASHTPQANSSLALRRRAS